MNFAATRVKAWKDVWGAGQGMGNIGDVPPARELIERSCVEYAAAKARLLGEPIAAAQPALFATEGRAGG